MNKPNGLTYFFLLIIMMLTGFTAWGADENHENAGIDGDTLVSVAPVSKTLWVKQLFANGFHINDPDVQYPRFPRFLLKVYNWGDRVFNGYDPAYVVSTGHNWKVLGKSYNWLENYAMIFSRHKTMRMSSDMYADIGGYLCFMAVSVGYMFNANELIGDRDNNRTNFNLNFTCSRFTVDYTATSTTGGARITHFGSYNDSHDLSMVFDGVSNKSKTLTAMYFFNNRRFSHAAAYCFSKYQLKSAGSPVAGFYYGNQQIAMDFSRLPQDMLNSLPESLPVYKFHYDDYALLGGYAYNWALKPRRWLLNVTGVVGAGYKKTREDATDGVRGMVAFNPLVTGSVVYNHRALFLGAQLRYRGSFYFNSNYTFYNALLSGQLIVGARF